MKICKEIPEMDSSDIVRFWSKVRVASPEVCWEWQAKGHFLSGAGAFRMISGNRKYRQILAPRVAYFLGRNQQPTGMLVCHKCDNPKCCNPNHLFLGTSLDNERDKISKGRIDDRRWNKSHYHKITRDVVVEIRKRAASGEKQRRIAEAYNLDPSNISHIVRHKTWRGV